MINPPTGAAVPQEELEAIRARHEAYKEAKADDAFYSSPNGYPPPSTNKIADVAHTDRAALLRAVDRLSAELAAERERRVEVEKLVRVLLENDPDDLVSDGGHTVLDLWRHDARATLTKDTP